MTQPVAPGRGTRGAAAALALVSLIWGYNWITMKLSLIDAAPTDSAAWRFLIGALALAPVVWRMGHSLRVPRSEWWLCALLAALLACNFTGTLWGLKLGGTGRVAVLTYTMPFWTVLLARVFLHERMRTAQWIAISLAAAGLIVLIDPTHLGGLLPSLLALFAGLSWGASVVLVKRIQGKTRSHLTTLTFWQMLIGAGLLALGSLAANTPPVRWTPLFTACLLYSAVLGSSLAWILFYYALARLPAGVAGLGTLATPVVGVIAAALQFGERPSGTEMVGMVLIGVGLAMLALPAGSLRGPRS